MYVISASGLATFLRCRKSFQIQYEWMREPRYTNQYVEAGSSFHAVMERAAKESCLPPERKFDPAPRGNTWLMAYEYLRRHPLPTAIVGAETPWLYPVLGNEGVFIRMTPDLVFFRTKDTLVVRDYKTFSRVPSVDTDLDTQARLYLLGARHFYPGKNIEFEYEYVRTDLPNTPRNKRGEQYTDADCYMRFTVNASDEELDLLAIEVMQIVDDIYDAREKKHWYRNGIKGTGPHTCASCFVNKICTAEIAGTLDEYTLDIHTKPRKPLYESVES